MNAPAMPTMIGGRYRVLRELGRGGFGAVYLVEHVHTGDHLALKILYGQAARDPMSIERFKREARAAAQIRNDHVVKVIDADAAPELDGAPFLVMELLDGDDLDKVLERRGALLAAEVAGVFVQIGRALDKAHSLGIVHRDLKPENLFLHKREDGSSLVKILDFGISKAGEAGNELGGAGRTATGAVLGTPLYMSPEQARGLASEISPMTDVWALGLIAFTLLSGHSYWTGNSVAELLVNILTAEYAYPSQLSPLVPPGFDAWFLKSCDRDPQRRFRSVSEQTQALIAALGVTEPTVPAIEVAPVAVLALAPFASGHHRSVQPAISVSDEVPRYRPSPGAAAGPLAPTTQTAPHRSGPPLGFLVAGGAVAAGLVIAAAAMAPKWLAPPVVVGAVVVATSATPPVAASSPAVVVEPAAASASAAAASASAATVVVMPVKTPVAGGKKVAPGTPSAAPPSKAATPFNPEAL